MICATCEKEMGIEDRPIDSPRIICLQEKRRRVHEMIGGHKAKCSWCGTERHYKKKAHTGNGKGKGMFRGWKKTSKFYERKYTLEQFLGSRDKKVLTE